MRSVCPLNNSANVYKGIISYIFCRRITAISSFAADFTPTTPASWSFIASWSYYTASVDSITQPQKVVTGIEIQISTHAGSLDGAYDNGRIFEHKIHNIEHSHELDLSGENIYWNDIHVIDMAYDDKYELHYVIPFLHQPYNPNDE